MAITGDMFNGLIFGNVNSINYGIYITGEAVYNAPKRAVELVSVPSRNGAIAIDQGYWENIEISYPAGTFADNQVDFARAISDFRNAIMAQVGYQKLMDSYNPNEYRMAMYLSGLEVDVAQLGQAGEFELTFNAKPQRWLLTGDIATAITDGQALTNPTLHASSPMLEVTGYGTIQFNGYTIEIADGFYGKIAVNNGATINDSDGESNEITLQSDLYQAGDTITLSSLNVGWQLQTSEGGLLKPNVVSNSGGTTHVRSVISEGYFTGVINGYTVFSNLTFTAGTSSTNTYTGIISVGWAQWGNVELGTVEETLTLTVTITVSYDASTEKISVSKSFSTNNYTVQEVWPYVTSYSATYADSTLTYLGNPTYIDCDLGECFKIENDETIDLNAYIDLGSDLPTLASGSNTITYDNTVTALMLYPRWWQL